jgi:anaerobic C4-dicarboxylate transporter
MSFGIQLAILLGAILLGARRGGMALGPMGGIGLFIFVFVFGLPPGTLRAPCSG